MERFQAMPFATILCCAQNQSWLEPFADSDLIVFGQLQKPVSFCSSPNSVEIARKLRDINSFRQVHLSGRGMVVVLVNGRQTEFDEEPMLDFRGVSVMRLPNTSTVDVIFKSGISLRAEGHRELLGFQLLIPKMFKGSELCRTRKIPCSLHPWGALLMTVLLSWASILGQVVWSPIKLIPD